MLFLNYLHRTQVIPKVIQYRLHIVIGYTGLGLHTPVGLHKYMDYTARLHMVT